MSTVIVSNLPKNSSDEDIKEFFAFGDKAGNVEEITPLDSSHDTKTVRIHFDSSDPIANALLLNGTDFQDSTVRVVEESGGTKSLLIEEDKQKTE